MLVSGLVHRFLQSFSRCLENCFLGLPWSSFLDLLMVLAIIIRIHLWVSIHDIGTSPSAGPFSIV